MVNMRKQPPRTKNLFVSLITVCVFLAGALACGAVAGAAPPAISTHYCEEKPAADQHRTEKLLRIVVGDDICFLNPNNGILQKHINLDQATAIQGYANGLLYYQQNNPDEKDAHGYIKEKLCAFSIAEARQRWCQPLVMDRVSSPMLSAHGIVYFITDESRQQGSIVLALSEADGHIVWSYFTGYSKGVLLRLYNGTLYTDIYQNNEFIRDNPTIATRSLCAIQASNGKKLWCFNPPENGIDNFAIDDLVYVRTGTPGVNYSTAGGSAAVYALTSATGSVVWSKSLGVSYTDAYHPLMLASHGLIYVNVRGCRCSSSSDISDYLYALRAGDGSQAWIKTVPSVRELAVADTTVYIGSSDGEGIIALHTSDGSRSWQYKTSNGNLSLNDNLVSRLMIDGQIIYVSGFFPYSTVMALDRRTGKSIWRDNSCAKSSGATATPKKPISLYPTPSGPCYWGETRGQLLLPMTS